MPRSSDAPRAAEVSGSSLTIAVAGGGIAGLAVATLLLRAGHAVRVFERRRSAPQTGECVGLKSCGLRVLEALGVWAELKPHVGRNETTAYFGVDAAGAETELVTLRARGGPGGGRVWVMPRARLAAALERALADAGGAVERARGVASVRRHERATAGDDDDARLSLVLDDATEAGPFDVVVGADGIGSRVRPRVLGRDDGPPARLFEHWGGSLPAALVSRSLCQHRTHSIFVADGKRVSVCPYRGGAAPGEPAAEVYFFFSCRDAPPAAAAGANDDDDGDDDAEIEHVRAIFAPRFPARVGELITVIAAELARRRRDEGGGGGATCGGGVAPIARWTVRDLPPPTRFARGRVALIGDAAHALAPTVGRGATLALEDAAALASSLAGGGARSSASVAERLREYEAERLPPARELHAEARRRVSLYYPASADEWRATREWYGALRRAGDEQNGAKTLGGWLRPGRGAESALGSALSAC